MSDDINTSMPSFDYLKEEKKPKKKTKQMAKKTEIEVAVQPKSGWFSNLFKRKEPVKATPPKKAKINPVDNSDVLEGKTVKWRVPEHEALYVQVCADNGAFISEYKISTYIRLNPGQILKVVAK